MTDVPKSIAPSPSQYLRPKTRLRWLRVLKRFARLDLPGGSIHE